MIIISRTMIRRRMMIRRRTMRKRKWKWMNELMREISTLSIAIISFEIALFVSK